MKAPEFLNEDQARFLADEDLQSIVALIEAAGGEVRVNGGAVRNALLGEPVQDVDLSTTLTPQAATECLERGGIKVVATGIEHGTVTAVAGGRGFEITTLREDVETYGRRAVVRFGTDWRADALRRDFTMNALYCDRHGRLFDPLDGYGDLSSRRVRFIGSAEARIREDYLRILRFFRMYAWYGGDRPDGEGLKACMRLKGKLSELSAERVWQELKKLLSAPNPVRAVLWMRTSTVLMAALPESGNWGVDILAQLAEAQREAQLGPDALGRLMAILPPRVDTVDRLAERLKLSRREHERLRQWAAQESPAPEMPESAFVKQLYRGPVQAIVDAMLVELARERTYQGRTERADRLAARIGFARAWRKPAFPIAGRDLLDAGMKPGPQLGDLLTRLEAWWVDKDFSPQRAELMAEARRLVSAAGS